MTLHPPVAGNYADARVVILGATGFIGRWVGRLLAGHAATLHLVVRDRTAATCSLDRWEVTGEIVEQDLEDLKGTSTLLRKLRPSVVFNLAGYGVDPSERTSERAYRVNAQLVETVADTLVGRSWPSWRGQALVHVGSALEYGPIGGDLDEASEPKPTTLYGTFKLAGTRALSDRCRSHGLRTRV